MNYAGSLRCPLNVQTSVAIFAMSRRRVCRNKPPNAGFCCEMKPATFTKAGYKLAISNGFFAEVCVTHA